MVLNQRFDAAKVRLLVLSLALVSAAALASNVEMRSGGTTMSATEAAITDLVETVAALLPAEPPISPIDLDDGRSPVGSRWRASFENFSRRDSAAVPATDGVVFVGSSSISSWDGIAQAFPERHVISRGLGGARMADCARHLDRLALPYRPRTIVVYAGDNDLAEGVSPEGVLEAYADLVDQVRRALPQTRVAFVSIKPSPMREALLPLVRRTNALIAAYTASDVRLDYVDVFTPMLAAGGLVRPELFRPDGLHLNGAGYRLWSQAIAHHLD
jgi:lysophospholipase L1-like esterase